MLACKHRLLVLLYQADLIPKRRSAVVCGGSVAWGCYVNTTLVLASHHEMGGLWSILRVLAILPDLFKSWGLWIWGVSPTVWGCRGAFGDASPQCRAAHASITAFENQWVHPNRVCAGRIGGGGANTCGWRRKKKSGSDVGMIMLIPMNLYGNTSSAPSPHNLTSSRLQQKLATTTRESVHAQGWETDRETFHM